jgi:hypothetical protein
MVTDPPVTMDSDSLTSEVQFDWRRRQIGRLGKEDKAMDSPTLELNKVQIFFKYRYIRTAGLAEIVCGANIRPRLLQGGSSCKKAET